MNRVDSLIERVMADYPRETPAALAKYFEAVHQELAPLARTLEAENAALIKVLNRISAPANAGCGCSFPCQCDSESWEAIRAGTMREMAQEVLEKIGQ